MISRIDILIEALDVIKKDAPDSRAISLLQKLLTATYKSYILDISKLNGKIDFGQAQEDIKEALKTMNIDGLNNIDK